MKPENVMNALGAAQHSAEITAAELKKAQEQFAAAQNRLDVAEKAHEKAIAVLAKVYESIKRSIRVS